MRANGYINGVLGGSTKGHADGIYLTQKCSRAHIYFSDSYQPIKLINSKGTARVPGSKSLKKDLQINDQTLVSFISQVLEWDPSKRLTPRLALAHPWLTS